MLAQLAVFAVALKVFSKNVFVDQVMKNAGLVASDNYIAILKYLVKAFLNTHPFTQVVVLAGLGVVALLIRDIGRSLLTYKGMWMRRNG